MLQPPSRSLPIPYSRCTDVQTDNIWIIPHAGREAACSAQSSHAMALAARPAAPGQLRPRSGSAAPRLPCSMGTLL